jgi:hypothetical protein
MMQTSRRADVDAEFERVGADHGHDRAVAQALFDFAAFGGQVAAAVAADLVVVFA